MSILDQQLKELTAKKLKSDFYKLLNDHLELFTDPKFTQELHLDVRKEISAFIRAQVDMIETGEIRATGEISELFTSEEVKTLKALCSKALNKVVAPISDEPKPKIENTQDKISFAMKHRQLGGREVVVQLKEGNFPGKVVGLDAPSVIIKLENGATVAVGLEQVMVK